MYLQLQSTYVIIADAVGYRSGLLDAEAAMTLIQVAIEDPAGWEDIAACWPRYRTPSVAEHAERLPLEVVDRATIQSLVQQHDEWLAIDLLQKRLIAGEGLRVQRHSESFLSDEDDDGSQSEVVLIELPPWWERQAQADRSALHAARRTPLDVPRTNRELLFGSALHQGLTERILDVVQSEAWHSSGALEDESRRYPFTVQVHREWLMTPHPQLQGRIPRELLHGGRKWIDEIIWRQELRCNRGFELVALPEHFTDLATAPLGTEEIAIYFELCRTLIELGWEWCVHAQAYVPNPNRRALRHRDLADFLALAQQEWMNSPWEGGAPPRFILECNRRRVPRACGVAIAGIDGQQPVEHQMDCDCPICIMLAEAGPDSGVSFDCIDGHHLELDGEFAFSLCATREEWEEEQRGFETMVTGDKQTPSAGEADLREPDLFAPVWSGVLSGEPLPGDSQGHLSLAFLMTETVGVLQSAGAGAAEIKELNQRFVELRHERPTLTAATIVLAEYLEELAERYPQVVSRAADLQSRLYERLAAGGAGGWE